jgi:secondary thiamine-phosphate synthase enzyme
METIQLETHRRTEFRDITAEVRKIVRASGVSDGMCLVSSPHTTAGITVQEHADPDVMRDLDSRLALLVPQDADWRHDSEGNADSHVKATLVGPSQVLPVSEGELVLGTWQGIFFCEFDGPRSRRVHVKIVGA